MYNYTIANDISELKQNRIWKKNKKKKPNLPNLFPILGN